MAWYKNAHSVSVNHSDEFDKIYEPGAPTPHSGIYRCINCGKEATSVLTHPLPPQNHHQHPAAQAIRWQNAQ